MVFGREAQPEAAGWQGNSSPPEQESPPSTQPDVEVKPADQAQNGGDVAGLRTADGGAAAAVDSLERRIERFEALIERGDDPSSLAEPGAQAPAADVLARLQDALVELSGQVRHLSAVAERLAVHLAGADISDGARPQADRPPGDHDDDGHRRSDAVFQKDATVSVIVSGVPGFQGLMDAQRGLNSLEPVRAASVVAFRNGEATLEVSLRAPIRVEDVVQTLGRATDQEPTVETLDAGASLLRLRFEVNDDTSGRGSLGNRP
jgi:hypothetical protein